MMVSLEPYTQGYQGSTIVIKINMYVIVSRKEIRAELGGS
jgi:hypothetical protein